MVRVHEVVTDSSTPADGGASREGYERLAAKNKMKELEANATVIGVKDSFEQAWHPANKDPVSLKTDMVPALYDRGSNRRAVVIPEVDGDPGFFGSVTQLKEYSDNGRAMRRSKKSNPNNLQNHHVDHVTFSIAGGPTTLFVSAQVNNWITQKGCGHKLTRSRDKKLYTILNHALEDASRAKGVTGYDIWFLKFETHDRGKPKPAYNKSLQITKSGPGIKRFGSAPYVCICHQGCRRPKCGADWIAEVEKHQKAKGKPIKEANSLPEPPKTPSTIMCQHRANFNNGDESERPYMIPTCYVHWENPQTLRGAWDAVSRVHQSKQHRTQLENMRVL